MNKLKIDLEYETECETIEDAQEELAKYFSRNNMLPETEFWGNMEFIEGEQTINDEVK